MPITPDDIAYIARLARLELTDEEIDRFGRELARITDYVAQLSEAVADRESTKPVLPLIKNVEALRDDIVTPWFDGRTVVAQAPDANGFLFRVPKVLG